VRHGIKLKEINVTDESPLVQAQEAYAQKIPFRSLSPEKCILEYALGRVTSHDISAPIASPPYSRAIVEGYLVNTSETKAASDNSSASFKIAGEIKPGDSEPLYPKEGEGIQVSTGSIIGDGNYSIVRMWEAKISDDNFTISRPFPPRFFIEDKGCDIEQGSTIIPAGTKLTPSLIGTLASMGINEVEVVRQPVVTVFSSGDEVIAHTDDFKPGYIFDCNTPMLLAAIAENGGIAKSGGIQSDNFDHFVAAVKTALTDSDMIVIAGGTAIDGRDFISDLLREVGELALDGVQMRSGRPLIMGVAESKPIVCVAGHPPEALRGFQLFGKLAINRLTGQDLPIPTDPNNS